MLAYDLWVKFRASLIIQIADKVGLVKVALKEKSGFMKATFLNHKPIYI